MLRRILAISLIISNIFGSAIRADEVVKIGWIGPLTGPAAILGVDAEASLRMALAEGNKSLRGTQIQLIAQDDQYDTAQSLRAYEYLVHQQRVKVIVMLTYGAIFALAERAKIDSVVLIDPLDCDDRLAALPESVFCLSKSTEQMGELLGSTVMALGAAPVGMLVNENDPFMSILAEHAIKKFSDLPREQVQVAYYNRGASDFRAILTRFKAKNVRSIIFLGYDEMGLAMKQGLDLGMPVRYFATNTMQSVGYLRAAGAAARGALLATWLAPRTSRYRQWRMDFEATTGRSPNFETSAVPSYDCGQVLIDAFRQQGSLDPRVVGPALLALRDYAGVSGQITMDPDGAVRSLKSAMYMWDGSGVVPVQP